MIEFTVGKYTLESLTNGMYSSPLDLYREYIQNAVDSLDEAEQSGIEKKENLNIEVSLILESNKIIIRDNGCGISNGLAAKTLLDIGNSKKDRNISRGFRGIGRLAGLGYCSKLIFTTSTKNESTKTIISFDANKLKELLLFSNQDNLSIHDVLQEIVSIENAPEKAHAHYFEVSLEDVTMPEKLLNYQAVKDYLLQHAPLPFDPTFKWGSLILSKFNLSDCKIKDYHLTLNFDGQSENLFKPYQNNLVSDRVKKLEDSIQDIAIVPFYRNDKLSAILWYAQTNFLGTILDQKTKGIRIRQGNILIGGKSTCNHFFKEERFNGWTIGELHIYDTELIINSRRDDFEQNRSYYEFIELLSNWSATLSKEIRAKSYARSLTIEKKAIIEIDSFEDINALGSEDFDIDLGEASLSALGDSESIAESDFYDKFTLIMNQKKAQTKYSALNINDRLTIEQRRLLERVFDIIVEEYAPTDSEKFINIISKKY